MLPQRIKYGVRALAYMSFEKGGTLCTAKEISSELNIPKEFISKILQTLVNKHILFSKKGHHGGFYFTETTESITLHQVYSALDYRPDNEDCYLGMEALCTQIFCDLCNDREILYRKFVGIIKRITIKDLSKIEL